MQGHMHACRLHHLSVLSQMKDKYANEKPYGKWLEAQVATLPDLVNSVPEHLLKVPTIHSGHNPLEASPVSPSSSKGSNGQGTNGQSNGQGSNGRSSGAPNGSTGTLSSNQEGGQVGVNASNGHANGGAGVLSSLLACQVLSVCSHICVRCVFSTVPEYVSNQRPSGALC